MTDSKFTAEDRRALEQMFKRTVHDLHDRRFSAEELEALRRLLAPGGPLDGVESDPEREAFEADRPGEYVLNSDGEYRNLLEEERWIGWQAGRRQARAAREGGKA